MNLYTMKRIYVLLFCFYCFSGIAQEVNHGIEFYHGNWSEALEKAKQEKKLIFVDFYTKWCGPCLAMAEEVFTQSFVGDFYNTHFVNCKIDAENGEGVELAKRYGVNLFPTYVFVNPEDGTVVHRSKSRQSAEQFLATGRGATVPELRSDFLLQEFEKGRRDREFLVHYIDYNASVYDREKVTAAFDILVEQGGKLTEPELWRIFDSYITGAQNKYLQEVGQRYSEYIATLGKKTVDNKLYRETRYCSPEELAQMPDFDGKRLNLQMNRINSLVRDKKYDEADALIRVVMADTTLNRQDFIDQFKYTVRNSCRHEDTPLAWLTCCASYLQYIAYNDNNRQDAYIHQEYAAMLERLVRRTPGAEGVFPESVLREPEFGVKEYDLRSRSLAKKPVRKRK